jgi:hypothetical protein
MYKNNFAVEDGIYVVHRGILIQLDGFEFGYEGFATWSDKDVRVEESDGRLILRGGQFAPELDKVASRTGEYRRHKLFDPQPPEMAERFVTAADGSGQVKFFAVTANRIGLVVTDWLECPWGRPGEIVPGQPFDHEGRVKIIDVGVYRDIYGRWYWDIGLKRLG